MASRVEASPKPRAGLSRDRVLRVAVQIADTNGIESLTMRNLAEKLGVEAMTLYHYVASKDDILSHILDLVVGEFEAASDEGGWSEAVRRSAISAHQVLLRHPWACSLMMSPARIGPARLRYMESLLGRLRGADFSAEMTHHAYHALDSHILGFTMWEVGYTTGIRELPDSGATLRRQISLDDYPYLVEHMGEHNKPSNGDGEFGFGLDLILDGLEKLRAIPPAAAASRVKSRARTGTRRARPRRRPSC
jgi:AcrR family transcriptional regulator